ncbi:uncharacterized protein O3C94_002785 [Discoglossus pictus]
MDEEKAKNYDDLKSEILGRVGVYRGVQKPRRIRLLTLDSEYSDKEASNGYQLESVAMPVSDVNTLEKTVPEAKQKKRNKTSKKQIKQAKELQLSKNRDKLETEIIVEEAVIFSTVSQVIVETENVLTNEAELTSEALTALEESIEISCAEETTEMLSAFSQLEESPATTDEATPVPEESDSAKSVEEQQKHVDHILQAVAESAKLSVEAVIDTINNTKAIPDLTEHLEVEVKENILEPVTITLQDSVCVLEKIENPDDAQTTLFSCADNVDQLKRNILEYHQDIQPQTGPARL